MSRLMTIKFPRSEVKAASVSLTVAAVVAPVSVGASHTITDVDASNVHHDNVIWLADAGVTVGCRLPINDRPHFRPSAGRGRQARGVV